jgi:hypothetical protein
MVAGIPGPDAEDDAESELLLDRHHHHHHHHRSAAMAARVRLHEKLRRLNGHHHIHSSAHHCHRYLASIFAAVAFQLKFPVFSRFCSSNARMAIPYRKNRCRESTRKGNALVFVPFLELFG